ncbi:MULTISPECIES: methyltransferase domain-containing protein [Streptomyces]|uniref:methyltransferase domain-containing protein n=1 Tax=Streptomyces TaxID=1883 RepID=UPI002248ED3F|nr:methyltransferase domain-containing protein [Streptomyces sp. JHD 1]MCX2967644.1 methyltransferase domain-containing protein [Streptomyces sp. JHD 1]
MDNELGYALGCWALSRVDGPGVVPRTTFSLLDREWDLLPGVWPPYHDQGTALFSSWLPYAEGCRFLEMGCGAGVTSVIAAQRGCGPVVAVDVVPSAVENARRNAARHGVADRVTALAGDLFAPLEAADTFDLVFWNAPFIEAPEDRSCERELERAIFDPGYALQRRFFREVQRHLAPGGRVYLGTSEAMGNPRKTLASALAAGFEGRRYRTESVVLPAGEDIGAAPRAGASPTAAPASTATAAPAGDGVVEMDFTLYEFRRC